MIKETISEKQFVEDCLYYLSEVIGERPVGSVNNQKAQKFISDIFKDNGLEVEEQSFECMGWDQGETYMSIGEYKIPVEASPYSLPCSVSAKFQFIETIERLRSAELRGKIVVLDGKLTKEVIMTRKFGFWNVDQHQEILQVLEDKQPLAVVTISFSEELPIPVIQDGGFDVPNFVVPGKYRDIIKLLSAEIITLKSSCERKKSTGANVIGRLNKDFKEKILLCAHFDSKPGTPGALDNASGVSTLLLLSRLIKMRDWNIGLELAAFNGEDYFSTPGQITYLEKYSSDLKKVKFVLNCDAVGYKEGKTGVSSMKCSDTLNRVLVSSLRSYNNLTLSMPWYKGDHMIFVGLNIPAVAIASEKAFDLVDRVIHTEKDVLGLVNPQIVCETANYIFEVLNNIRKIDNN